MPFKTKEEQRAYQRKWRRKNNASANLSRVKYKFGLTTEDAKAVIALVDGGCAICGQGWKKRLCIDHDHKSGKVRGVLCHNCNVVLGLVRDNVKLLERMVEYLNASD